MQAAVEKAAGKLLESVKLFDVYKGKGIPDGKKSVAYSLSMRAPDRTLTDEECDKAMRAAISALETEFGAQLRGKFQNTGRETATGLPSCVSGAGACLCRGWKKILLEFSAE